MFGCLSEYTDAEVKEYLDSAITNNYVQVSKNRFPILSISEKGYSLVGKKLEKQVDRIKLDHNYSDELYEKLKLNRKKLSMEKKRSEESIISDDMLMKLSSDSPKNILELRKLNGYDLDFVRNYGADFVAIINDYHSGNDESDSIDKVTEVTKRIVVLFQKHIPINELADRLELTDKEVVKHLKTAVRNDIDVDMSHHITESRYEEILDMVEEDPEITTSQVREEMGPIVDYNILKIVLAKAKNELEYN